MLSVSEAIHWLQLHLIEIIAVITGLLYIIFTIRENILLWIFGIISSAIYVWIFYDSRIYAYSVLYIYYVIMGIYGWINWTRKVDSSNGKSMITIRRTPSNLLLGCILSAVLLTVPLFLILKKFTDSDMALVDAILTSGGMVATWMLTQKYLEQWLFWIVINALSFGAMIYKELYPSALLFFVYGLLAVKGYWDWNKEMKTALKT